MAMIEESTKPIGTQADMRIVFSSEGSELVTRFVLIGDEGKKVDSYEIARIIARPMHERPELFQRYKALIQEAMRYSLEEANKHVELEVTGWEDIPT
jgi:hypothetical protein